jgi:hypothetical protein
VFLLIFFLGNWKMLKSFVDWVTWGALVLPLAAVAWSAVSYVLLQQQLRKDREYSRFFECMEQIGRNEYSIAAKMAAISELKKFPEYKEVILRLCQGAGVGGEDAWLLEREFDVTAKHYGSLGRAWSYPERLNAKN